MKGAKTLQHLKHSGEASISEPCPVERALQVVGGKWKLLIVARLADGQWRFNALHRSLPGLTARLLTKQLRELEEQGAVSRTVHDKVPPHVEYSLTDSGRDLLPIIAALDAWGRRS